MLSLHGGFCEQGRRERERDRFPVHAGNWSQKQCPTTPGLLIPKTLRSASVIKTELNSKVVYECVKFGCAPCYVCFSSKIQELSCSIIFSPSGPSSPKLGASHVRLMGQNLCLVGLQVWGGGSAAGGFATAKPQVGPRRRRRRRRKMLLGPRRSSSLSEEVAWMLHPSLVRWTMFLLSSLLLLCYWYCCLACSRLFWLLFLGVILTLHHTLVTTTRTTMKPKKHRKTGHGLTRGFYVCKSNALCFLEQRRLGLSSLAESAGHSWKRVVEHHTQVFLSSVAFWLPSDSGSRFHESLWLNPSTDSSE